MIRNGDSFGCLNKKNLVVVIMGKDRCNLPCDDIEGGIGKHSPNESVTLSLWRQEIFPQVYPLRQAHRLNILS